MSKELKVGDRVRIYGRSDSGQITATASVRDVTTNGITLDHDDENSSLSPFNWHPKQLRRLVKKPRREFWAFKCACSRPTIHTAEPVAHCQNCGDVEVFRVREVRK